MRKIIFVLIMIIFNFYSNIILIYFKEKLQYLTGVYKYVTYLCENKNISLYIPSLVVLGVVRMLGNMNKLVTTRSKAGL